MVPAIIHTHTGTYILCKAGRCIIYTLGYPLGSYMRDVFYASMILTTLNQMGIYARCEMNCLELEYPRMFPIHSLCQNHITCSKTCLLVIRFLVHYGLYLENNSSIFHWCAVWEQPMNTMYQTTSQTPSKVSDECALLNPSTWHARTHYTHATHKSLWDTFTGASR